MYFYNEDHQSQFEELVSLNQQGGQQNEKIASLYVAALLPARVLADFKQQEYIIYEDLVALTDETNPKGKRLSTGEKQLIRLAYVLFHGDDRLDVQLSNYLGYGYEYKEAVVQALQLHYGIATV